MLPRENVAGSGKTVLTYGFIVRWEVHRIWLILFLSSSIVVEHLRWNCDHTTGLICVYLDFRGGTHQTLSNILGSLLQQLVWRRPSLSSSVRTLYEDYQRGQGRPDPMAMAQLLRTEVSTYAKTFIVVDGLDEASTTVCTRLLNILHTLDVKLFVSSRPLTDVVVDLHEAIRIDMLAGGSDLKAFIRYELSNSTLVSPLSATDSSPQHSIIEKIVEKSNGS